MEVSIKEQSVKAKKKMIALELPQGLYDEVQALGKQMCLGTSAIVRLALMKYLETNKQS